MNKKKYSLLRLVGLILIGLLVSAIIYPSDSKAGGIFYQNPDTGYRAAVHDNADLLTFEEEQALLEKMKPITAYANVVYLTDNNNISCTESYSEDLCKKTLREMFGYESAVIYLVDNEYDYIKAQGDAERRINDTKAYNITDDVYMYSAKEKYYSGAVKAFSEIKTLLAGRILLSPVQFICNAFLALFIAFIINYALMKNAVKMKKTSLAEVIDGSFANVTVGVPDEVFTNQTKVYSPRSRSSGGGHGGGGDHGGGGHGGGHSH